MPGSNLKSLRLIPKGLALLLKGFCRQAGPALSALGRRATTSLGALALMLLSACSDSEAPEPASPEEGAYTVAFELTVQSPPEAATRAPEGDYDAGSSWENYIDVAGSNYRILFFSHDPMLADADLYLGSLRNVSLSLLAESETRKTYKVTGDISPEVAEAMTAGIVKIAVFANWGSYGPTDDSGIMGTDPPATEMRAAPAPGAAPDADQQITLSYVRSMAEFDFTRTLYSSGDRQMTLRASNLIPLYGVTNPMAGVKFDGNRYFHAGTIHLLRAYAKIEVVLAAGSIEIDEVRLRRFNTRGFLLPFSYRTQDDYLKGSYSGDYTHYTNIPSGNSVESGGTIILNKEDNNTWYLYVPEFNNIGKTDAWQSQIEIKFRDYDHYETLHFSRYTIPDGSDISRRGDDFDILRNNLYRFTVYKDLQVTVDVIPYTGIDLNPDFGFDEPLPRPSVEGEMPPWVEVAPE